MTDETITEEHEQVKQFVKRWRKNTIVTQAVTAVAIIIPLLILFRYPPPLIADNVVIAVLCAILIVRTIVLTIGISSRKRFVKQLHPQEEVVFLQILNTEFANPDKHLRELKRGFRTIQPEQEFVRPSQEPQDDTLLRAATSTDTTPKEQLLRPSQTDE